MLHPRRRIVVALHGVVMDAYVHGVSTRKVDDLSRRFDATSSPSPHAWPDRNVATCCTYPSTGPGPNSGPRCGATCSLRPPAPRSRL